MAKSKVNAQVFFGPVVTTPSGETWSVPLAKEFVIQPLLVSLAISGSLTSSAQTLEGEVAVSAGAKVPVEPGRLVAVQAPPCR